MPYLNIDFGFPDNIKTRRLVGLVGGNAEAEGLLVRLWCHIGAHHGDTGRLPGYTPQEIEAVVRWTGEPGKLVDALCKVGYLHKEGDSYRVHDWNDHQGHIAALKARAKAAAEKRWMDMRQAMPEHTSSNAPSNAPRTPKREAKQCSYPSKPSVPSKPAKPKDIAPASGANGSAAPSEKETKIQMVVRGWKIQSGVAEDDKDWDKAHFKRHCRPAESLVNLFGGDVGACLDCIESVWQEIVVKKKLDLSLQGVVNNSGRFRQVWLERKEKAVV